MRKILRWLRFGNRRLRTVRVTYRDNPGVLIQQVDLDGFSAALHAAGYTGPVKVEPFLADLARRPLDELLPDVRSRLERTVTAP